MAKSTALLAAEARIAALEAQLKIATEVCANQRADLAAQAARLEKAAACYREQRTQLYELREQLAAPVAPPPPPPQPQRFVRRYQKRDGSIWECVRVGDTTRHHRVTETEPA